MKFPNAHSGVKKIYIAQILSLVISVLFVISAILALASVKLESELGALSVVAAVSTLVLILAEMIPMILEIVGLVQAKKDEPCFKNALVFMLIALGAQVLSSALNKITVVSRICEIVSEAAQLGALLFIIQGILLLAEPLKRTDVARLGQLEYRILTTAYITIVLVNVLSTVFFYLPDVLIIGSWLTIAAQVLRVVAYVIYLVFLAKSVKMLRE